MYTGQNSLPRIVTGRVTSQVGLQIEEDGGSVVGLLSFYTSTLGEGVEVETRRFTVVIFMTKGFHTLDARLKF